MEPIISIAVAAGAAGAIAGIAGKDHRRIRAARRSLLNDCPKLFSGARLSYMGDDFPLLEGWHAGRRARAELIPDTMTIKRLPQLWLSLSLFELLPAKANLAVLVRPSGNDFYSLTEQLTTTLRPPSELPWEVLARGSGVDAQGILDRLAKPIGAILSDPRMKEVAITNRGLRLIRQAGQGRRGEHLLLRQAVFDNAAVHAADLERLLRLLDGLRTALIEAARVECSA